MEIAEAQKKLCPFGSEPTASTDPICYADACMLWDNDAGHCVIHVAAKEIAYELNSVRNELGRHRESLDAISTNIHRSNRG